MFYGNTNIDVATGVRYTVYSSHSIHPMILDELWYVHGTDLSYQDAREELLKEIESKADAIEEESRIKLMEVGGWTFESEFQAHLERDIEAAYEGLGYRDREDYIQTCMERESEYIEIDEPVIEGECQGIKYRISWLGGAPLLWVFESPFKQFFDLCSPCVPNACNGDNPNPDGYEGYAVDPEWLEQED